MIPRNYSKAYHAYLIWSRFGFWWRCFCISDYVECKRLSEQSLFPSCSWQYPTLQRERKCHPATGRKPESTSIRPFILPHLNDSLDLTMNLYCREFIHHKESTQYSSLRLTWEVDFNCQTKVHKNSMKHNTVILLITSTRITSNQKAMSDD